MVNKEAANKKLIEIYFKRSGLGKRRFGGDNKENDKSTKAKIKSYHEKEGEALMAAVG